MKSRSLLVQVLAVNLLLIAGAAVLGAVAANSDGNSLLRGREIIVVGLAPLATVLGNWLLLHRRFKPLEDLISTMEEIDLAAPARQAAPERVDSSEVRRLEAAFERMMARLESERRAAGRAAIGAQERERRRIAQDLHDEVNQALTAVSLRLQASIERAPDELRGELEETKRLSGRAMTELLALASQLRPAVLDDHGLLPALQSQVRGFAEQTGLNATFTAEGDPGALSPEQQLVLYRVTQESLSNVVQHAGADKVEVKLSCNGRTQLSVIDNGQGFSAPRRGGGAGGLGVSGMRERALLIGADLSIDSVAGHGTRIRLTIDEGKG